MGESGDEALPGWLVLRVKLLAMLIALVAAAGWSRSVNEETRLLEAMTALEPTANQVAHWQRRIEERVERESRLLAAEWLAMIHDRPLAHGGLTLGAACALLATNPIGSLLWALLRGGLGD